MSRNRILLVEDDTEVRQRLLQAIVSAPQFDVVADVGTLVEALAALSSAAPDIVVVDLGLPDGNGIELIRAAVEHSRPAQVMVITVFGDEAHVIAAIEAGATSYLLKDASSKHISRALEEMVDGGSPISASVARFLLRRFRAPRAAELTPLAPIEESPFSAREFDVLQLVAKGRSYNQIAAELGISINTVGSHIKQIYRKLAVNSRGEAVYAAQARGLISKGSS